MNAKLKKFLTAGFVAAYSAMSAQTALAEDIEIFFGGSNAPGVRPNILFMFDTSGSMEGMVGNRKKIEIIRESMVQVLDSVSNVNIGLARFSQPGGAILYPITYVDAPAEPMTRAYPAASSDDARQRTNNQMELTETTLIMFDSVDSHAGIRFANVNIPQGAEIESAVLTLISKSAYSNSISWNVKAELSADASTFVGVNKNISERTFTSSVNWTPGSWASSDDVQSPELKAIVQEVVNQPTWCGGNAMALVLTGTKATASAYREAYSFDGDKTLMPMLTVKFVPNFPEEATRCFKSKIEKRIAAGSDDVEEDEQGDIQTNQVTSVPAQLDVRDVKGVPNGPLDRNRAIGLRFADLRLPQGADVTNAYIEFEASDDGSGNFSANIQAINADDYDAFGGSTKYLTETAPKTTAVAWSTSAGWSAGQKINSPDISSIVKAVTSRTGWAVGNDMAFVLTPGSGNRWIKSYESNASSAAKLVVYFQGKYEGGVYTMREELKNATEGFKATDNTPISDTLLEGGLYFRGEPAIYGTVRGNPAQRDKRVSHPDAFVPTPTHTIPAGCSLLNPNDTACKGEKITGTYKSPIEDSCQANHLVFLSDGEPNAQDGKTATKYKAWTGGSCATSDGGVDCSKKIASFLRNKDQSSSLNGTQTVTTHMVGFDVGTNAKAVKFLKDVATAGGGGFYLADDADKLTATLQEIVDSILKINTTFVSAGVTVNQYNRLTHSDQLYFSLFSPSTRMRWPGNVKRYRLTGDGLVDVNNLAAVDQTSGEFVDAAKSYWSASADGNNVALGGAASRMTSTRNVYTDIAGSTIIATGNKLDENNGGITQGDLGATSAAERIELLQWVRGLDIDDEDRDGDLTDANQIFVDPLHSKPVLLSYRGGSGKSDRIFVGTNQGFLHSIDAATGNEAWAYLPKEMLYLLREYRTNATGVERKYGLDGSAVIHVDDSGRDGFVDVGTDKAWLYIGQRRGGTTYYAVDISDPDAPKLMFKIDSSMSNFSKLGQTWSRPVIAHIKGVSDPVLFFGGGYDTKQDTNGAPLTDTTGNAVFIVNAKTGAHIWDSSKVTSTPANAGPVSSMNSVPGDIAVVDIEGDGLIDHFYAADTKAQVFRFDINKETGKITGGRLAHLQDAATQVANRRFYYSPDVALIVRPDGSNFLSVAVGSGYREHPLDTDIAEHFYGIRDYGALQNGTFEKDIELADLLDVTAMVGDADEDGVSDASAKIEKDKYKGWYIDFTTKGEKVLATALTFMNTVFFTTYIPPGGVLASGGCSTAAGNSRLYSVSVIDGNPVIDTKLDGEATMEDRFTDLKTPGGISPELQILVTPEGDFVACIGTQCGDAGGLGALGEWLNDTLRGPGMVNMRRFKWRHNVNQ